MNKDTGRLAGRGGRVTGREGEGREKGRRGERKRGGEGEGWTFLLVAIWNTIARR